MQSHPAESLRQDGQLRLLYFITFIFVGALGNFLPLWLKDAGWTPADLGWLEATRYATVLVMPLFWGWLIDRWGDAVGVLRLVSVGCFVCLAPLVVSTEFILVLLTLLCFSLFRVGQIPAMDALTLSHVRRHGGEYGRFRSWGSLGFIIGGLMLGVAVELSGRDIIPWALWSTLLLTIAVVFSLRRERWLVQNAQRFKFTLLAPLWTRRDLRALYLAALLSRLTQHGLYGFLPLHLERLGVADWWVPAYWSVGVLSEIVLIRNTPRLFGRLGTRRTLITAASVAVLQFGLMAYWLNPWLLLAVMPLHGITFGVWYVASMEHLGQTVEPESRGVAQACFQISAFGIGGTISAVSAGYLYAAGQGELMFGTAAAVSVTVALVVALTFPRRA